LSRRNCWPADTSWQPGTLPPCDPFASYPVRQSPLRLRPFAWTWLALWRSGGQRNAALRRSRGVRHHRVDPASRCHCLIAVPSPWELAALMRWKVTPSALAGRPCTSEELRHPRSTAGSARRCLLETARACKLHCLGRLRLLRPPAGAKEGQRRVLRLMSDLGSGPAHLVSDQRLDLSMPTPTGTTCVRGRVLPISDVASHSRLACPAARLDRGGAPLHSPICPARCIERYEARDDLLHRC